MSENKKHRRVPPAAPSGAFMRLLFHQKFTYLSFNCADFRFKGLRGYAQGTVAENNQLLGGVGSDDAGVVAAGYLMGGLFDVHVGGLGLLGVDDLEVVVLFNLTFTALHLVGVKD